MTCRRCKHQVVKKFGFYGKGRVQRYRCHLCHATFSEPQQKPLGEHRLDVEKAVKVLGLMMEGVSIRAIERLTGVHKSTILALLVTIGERCREVFNERVRDVWAGVVQADELWTFVHTKEDHMSDEDPDEWGDAYIWMAIEARTKLVISYHVGKRTAADAMLFVKDFSERVHGKLQLTTDGLRDYISAVEEYFGGDIDFAQLVKVYGRPKEAGPDWYGPPEVIAAIPTPITGEPSPWLISTSYVERANLSVRTHLRRFVRLTNGHSKKLDNLKACVAIYMAWFNFCRVHSTLRVTPAMESGLTDHVWDFVELLTPNTEHQHL
jgi:transposase-like protein/IS1 family transposase